MRLCTEIAKPLKQLKAKIPNKETMKLIDKKIRLLVLNVSNLTSETLRKDWIKSIRKKIEAFVAEKSDDIGEAVLAEVKRCTEMVKNTLDGIDDTVYSLYGME